jgi:hypothetical protein
VNDGWGPVQVSSHTPSWDYWRHGWGSQSLDTYNPAHYLTPAAILQLRYPRNYVIPRYTYVPEPNPYTDRRWVAMNRSREEIYRMGQDIDWPSVGTRGG